MSKIIEQLIKHEDIRLKPYRDTVGKLTIGVGRNLDDNGITHDEALYMLRADVRRVLSDLQFFGWFHRLNRVRRDVVINMVFNMGLTRFLTFEKTIKYISRKKYSLAAVEMLDSKWAGQVGSRATELAVMMRSGEY